MMFKVLWKIDEFAHAYLPPRVHRVVFGRMCDWLDDELCKPPSKFHGSR